MTKIARENPDWYNGLSAREEPAAMRERADELGLDRIPPVQASTDMPAFSFSDIFSSTSVSYSYREAHELFIPGLFDNVWHVRDAVRVIRKLEQPRVTELLEQLSLRGYTIEYPQTNKPVWRKAK